MVPAPLWTGKQSKYSRGMCLKNTDFIKWVDVQDEQFYPNAHYHEHLIGNILQHVIPYNVSVQIPVKNEAHNSGFRDVAFFSKI